MRLEGEHDPVGNPLYNVSTQIVIRVVNAPKDLRGSPTGATTPPPGRGYTGGPEIR
jgi:hypothetical protein